MERNTCVSSSILASITLPQGCSILKAWDPSTVPRNYLRHILDMNQPDLEPTTGIKYYIITKAMLWSRTVNFIISESPDLRLATD